MAIKLIKVAKEFNVSLHTIVETLHSKGFHDVEQKPTADITDEMLVVLQKEFQKDLAIKQEADKLARPVLKKDPVGDNKKPSPPPPRPSLLPPREPVAPKVEPPVEPPKEEPEPIKRDRPALRILGRINLFTEEGHERIKKCKDEKSKFLDLGNCMMTDLPTELLELEWLEGLNLNVRYRDPLTKKWVESNTGTKNNLKYNGIRGLEKLKKLKFLDLGDCNIQDIDPLKNLENLTELWLDSNQINTIEALSKLTNLRVLHLNKNQIENITPIAGLSQLSEIDLGNNKIQDIQVLSRLTGLTEVVLKNNNISDLRSLYALSNLKHLNISDNSIDVIYPLSRLTKLEHLDAGGNKIDNIILLRDLPKLKSVVLDGNPIQDCPLEFWSTNDIRQIRAYFDSISRRTEDAVEGDTETSRNTEIKLILVGNSGVGKTQLANLLTTGQYEDIRDTTHGIKVIRWKPDANSPKAFQELPKGFLINVWDFGGQEYYHGTHRLFLSNQAVYVLLWDKSTNMNSVLPTRIKDELVADLDHFHYRYWLESIRHYAPDSPILMIQNKVDDPEQPKERPKYEDLETFQVEHDGLALSLQKALSDDGGYQRLYLKFTEDLAEQLDKMSKSFQFNQAWLTIRNAIQDLSEGKTNAFSKALRNDAWMKLDKFRMICKKIDPDLTEDELYTLPSWLDRIGTLIYYPNNKSLKYKVFLKPHWITENIYSILNETVLSQNGEFDLDDLPENLKPFAATFIAMMKQMEIVFPHPIKANRFVAPQYLPAEHAVEDLFAIAELGLRQSSYRIRIPLFFYRKLMHRLILYFGIEADVTAKYYWKHGIVFVTKGGTRCLIKGLYPEEYQQEGVVLVGIENTSEFLNLQSEIFERILIILSNREEELGMKIHPPTLGVKSMVQEKAEMVGDMDPEGIADHEFYNNPFPPGWTEKYLNRTDKIPRWLEVLEVAVGNIDFVKYLDVCGYAAKGMAKFSTASGEVQLVKNFDPLLDRTATRPLKVFLSYSHNDLQMMRRLDTHLAPLKRLDRIESWNDRDILPGQEWDVIIRKQLNEADIVLLLVSADFVASEYIWKKEITVAMERMNRGECLIIPILLQPVDFEGLPFAEHQMIPFNEAGARKLLAVSLWNNQEEGMAAIAKEVRRVILPIEPS